MRRTDISEEHALKAGKAMIVSTLILVVLIALDALRYFVLGIEDIPFPSSTIFIIGVGLLIRSIYLSIKNLVLSANNISKVILMGLFSLIAVVFIGLNLDTLVDEGFKGENSLALFGVLLLIFGFFIESIAGYRAHQKMISKVDEECEEQ
ncbi:MAG: hypothetical protein RR601_05010 [Erysipelotrichales bacterium]